MVSQYPYTATISQQPETFFEASTGAYKPLAKVSTVLPCRFEPNSNGTTIKSVDGENYVYAFIVYLLKTSFIAMPGDDVVLTDASGNVVYTGKVKRYNANYFNCRIWV